MGNTGPVRLRSAARKTIMKLKTRARSEREIRVRRDKRKATPRMTRDRNFFALVPPDANPTGNWRAWWKFGCGSINGKPVCPPGHDYYIQRYNRGAKARSKVLGRRRDRRRNNARVAESW